MRVPDLWADRLAALRAVSAHVLIVRSVRQEELPSMGCRKQNGGLTGVWLDVPLVRSRCIGIVCYDQVTHLAGIFDIFQS